MSDCIFLNIFGKQNLRKNENIFSFSQRSEIWRQTSIRVAKVHKKSAETIIRNGFVIRTYSILNFKLKQI